MVIITVTVTATVITTGMIAKPSMPLLLEAIGIVGSRLMIMFTASASATSDAK